MDVTITIQAQQLPMFREAVMARYEPTAERLYHAAGEHAERSSERAESVLAVRSELRALDRVMDGIGWDYGSDSEDVRSRSTPTRSEAFSTTRSPSTGAR
jgi:hypothetical protein